MPVRTRRSRLMNRRLSLPKYKPSLYLTGKNASPLLKVQVGKQVALAVKGRVVSQGINTSAVGKPVTATIEVDEVR